MREIAILLVGLIMGFWAGVAQAEVTVTETTVMESINVPADLEVGRAGQVGMVYAHVAENGTYQTRRDHALFYRNIVNGQATTEIVSRLLSSSKSEYGSPYRNARLFYTSQFEPRIVTYEAVYLPDGDGWTSYTVNFGEVDLSGWSAILDKEDVVHFFGYENYDWGEGVDTRRQWHFWYDQGFWNSEVVEEADYAEWYEGFGFSQDTCSAAVDSQGFLHLLYVINYKGDLGDDYDFVYQVRYATNRSGQWVTERAFGPQYFFKSGVGYYPSLAIDAYDNPCVSNMYMKRSWTGGSLTDASLCYSRREGPGDWDTDTLTENSDGYAGNDGGHFTGVDSRLHFDTEGRPHILFKDYCSHHAPWNSVYEGQLRYVYYHSGKWRFKTLYHQPTPAEAEGEDDYYNVDNEEMYDIAFAISPGGSRVYVTGREDILKNQQESEKYLYLTADNSDGVDILPPSINLTAPTANNATADEAYLIQWTDTLPGGDATVRLYSDTDNSGYDGTLIAEGISAATYDSWIWDTSAVGEGMYYVYATIDDGINFPTQTYAPGVVYVFHGRVLNDFCPSKGWTVESHPRKIADVNGDGLDDILGFADKGIMVALSTGDGFSAPAMWAEDFGLAKGWQPDRHPRMFGDLNGDGMEDVMGFGDKGIMAATSTGSGFDPPRLWAPDFGYQAGWRMDRHPRMLGDVNGDGKMDVLGFGDMGVMVATSTGDSFSAPGLWLGDFGSEKGWTVDHHPRFLGDVSGDGLDDVAGFGDRGVMIATSNGSGFNAPEMWIWNFGRNQGWQVGRHLRFFADVNGDGIEDMLGFGDRAVLVGLSTGQTFGETTTWLYSDLVYLEGWDGDTHPRLPADMDQDGSMDIIGFGAENCRVALSNGNGFNASGIWVDQFGMAQGWDPEKHPRFVGDIDGDDILDVVGFYEDGVYVY